MRYRFAVLALCLGLNAAAMAATLKGTAKNGTTGKPAAGIDVTLYSLAGGMRESGRSKTDVSGGFRFRIDGAPASRLVRAFHQGVAYQALVAPGAGSVDIEVYDAAQKVDGISATLDVQRLQTAGDKLQVIEEIAVRNASQPPRTMIGRPLEIQLPPEAEVVAGRVGTGAGQPIKGKPSPGDQKGRYYFPFALPPGDTRFAVAYLLPYKGETLIEPKVLYPLENFLVVLPKSMKFEAKTAGMFQPRPGTTDPNVQEMAALKSDRPLAFRVSGTGSLAAHEDGRQQAQGGEARTGPLRNFRWMVLGGLAGVVMASLAGFLRHKRKQRLPVPASGRPEQECTAPSAIGATFRTKARIPGGTPSGVSPS